MQNGTMSYRSTVLSSHRATIQACPTFESQQCPNNASGSVDEAFLQLSRSSSMPLIAALTACLVIC